MTTEGMNPKRSKLVRFSGVSKVFKDPQSKQDVKAVNDVSFIAEPGQLVTLLGPSGCGKTTALRMIAGFEIPTAGKIFIGDEDITNIPPNLRDTAMVFQSYGLFPHMDVFENVAYGLRLRKIPNDKINAKVKLFLGMVGLEGLEKRPPSRLSGGQQQRVALARSLIIEPSVLLLDEPLSNLDAKLRIHMRTEIRNIQKQLDITFLYVTHDQKEALTMADRIMVMHKGKVEQIGTPFDIYTHPRTLFVADFIGQANVLAGTLESRESAVIGSIRIGDRVIPGKLIAEENYTAGERVSLILRPEAVTLSAKEDGVLSGTVSSAVFSGDRMEYMVRLSNGQEVSVMENFFPGAEIYSTGQQVQLTFDPRLTVVLPGER